MGFCDGIPAFFLFSISVLVIAISALLMDTIKTTTDPDYIFATIMLIISIISMVSTFSVMVISCRAGPNDEDSLRIRGKGFMTIGGMLFTFAFSAILLALASMVLKNETSTSSKKFAGVILAGSILGIIISFWIILDSFIKSRRSPQSRRPSAPPIHQEQIQQMDTSSNPLTPISEV